ncbi:CACTA en-spm transposon protein [Cucumis melo var. makuwa]|uniref:CACTA en-spm transposon protein n=1 Tax=Cucumis melo var. makuwa TaxID=1194695 RepID=A0A5A7VDG9_CUCMM|nr:CACTA en-spm transposon protein [Cucumis melo var. makuwa]
MTAVPGAEKPIFPHTFRFNQTISVYVRKTFPVCCLKWTNVGKEYIKIVKRPWLGTRLLFRDEICDQVLGRRPDYSKGLGWGPKPKARKRMSVSSSTTSYSQSATEREIQIQAKLDQGLERIELQDRNYLALALEMEQMQKLIQDMTRA